MIAEKHNPLVVNFFNHYSRWMIKWHFRELRYHSPMPAPKGPLLVIANHFSWWDGFFTVTHNHRHFQKTFHVMMLEDQLKKRKWLAKAGAFSIRKGNRSAIHSLKYAAQILTDPSNMLLMFPQGSIQSHHQHQFSFEKGIEKILNQSKNPPALLFLAHLIDYHAQRKPVAHVYASSPNQTTYGDSTLESCYNDFFNSSLDKHLKHFRP